MDLPGGQDVLTSVFQILDIWEGRGFVTRIIVPLTGFHKVTPNALHELTLSPLTLAFRGRLIIQAVIWNDTRAFCVV